MIRKRVGLLFRNIGHTAIYRLDKRMPATVLYLEKSFLVSVKTEEGDGYSAAIIGVGDHKNTKKPQLEYLKKQQIGARCKLFESRVPSVDGFILGSEFSVNHFVVDQYVDLMGYSIGKGFAGVMKRHNFKGMRASHGVSIAHRSQGSTGQCQDPGRVFKGKKMAGHLGDERVTVQNMQILLVDEERSLVVVKGNNVPGAKGSYVFVRDAVKKALPKTAPFPFGLIVGDSKVNSESV